MISDPKIKREVDKNYLAFIREQPCLVGCDCQGEVVYHHTVTVKTGGSDYKTLPLCGKHHPELHTIGQQTFQDKYSLDFGGEIIRLLVKYIKRGT